MGTLTQLKQLGTGLEAIAHQYDRNFFKALTEEARRLQELVNSTDAKELTPSMMAESKLPEIIMKGAGLKVSCYVDKYMFNASMMTTPIASFNVLYGGKVYHGSYAPEAALRLFQKYGKVIEGTVDYSKGTVGGLFSEIDLHLSMSRNLITIPDMQPEEVAAIILHEVGHGWSNIALCHYKMATNMVMTSAVAAIVSTPDKKRRIAIMTDLENSLGIEIPNKSELTDYQKFEEYYVVMLSAFDEAICSATGASAYDESMSEQMADMFAARHGAGKYIVTGLNKMGKTIDKYIENRRKETNIVFRSLCTTLSYGFTTLLAIPLIPVYLQIFITNNWMGGTYDREKDRYIRLRNESINALKDQTLSKDVREVIIAEIKEMDAIIADTSNDYGMVTKLAVIVRNGQRKQYRAKKLQQDLETLTNNPLYTTLAKLKG